MGVGVGEGVVCGRVFLGFFCLGSRLERALDGVCVCGRVGCVGEVVVGRGGGKSSEG